MSIKLELIEAFDFKVPTGERSSESYGVFVDEKLGKEFTKKKGYFGADGFGSKGEFYQITAENGEIFIFPKWCRNYLILNKSDVNLMSECKAKQKALEKLSIKERKLLGLI